MNGFVNSVRRDRCVDLPISMAQTELRAGKTLSILQIKLALGQRLELRSLSIGMPAVLTPGLVPEYLNTAMSMCSVGLYRGTIITGPLAYTTSIGAVTTTNPFSPCVVESPGVYNVTVSNNTSNLNLSVVVAGAIKLYY